jgi:hypothetical protein
MTNRKKIQGNPFILSELKKTFVENFFLVFHSLSVFFKHNQSQKYFPLYLVCAQKLPFSLVKGTIQREVLLQAASIDTTPLKGKAHRFVENPRFSCCESPLKTPRHLVYLLEKYI